jgi:predicted amino acid dehydrogenase
MTLDERVTFGLVLTAGVVIPGFAVFVLAQNGYDTLGTAVWVVGYIGMVLFIWYRWIRPLDLTGPVEE